MSASKCLRCAWSSGGSIKRSFVQPRIIDQFRSYATEPRNVSLKKGKPVLSNEDISEELDEATEESIAEMSEENYKPKPVPPNVLAAYRTPLRLHRPTGQSKLRVADLQLRSYSVRNLEFFADFAMRVAQYLKLVARGPEPIPKITERWTVSKSNFVHKKTQENFERITRRRVIKIYNGNKETVEVWLACLRKWQFYGVGMKANVYDWEGLDVVKRMDEQASQVEPELDKKLSLFGWNSHAAPDKSIQDMLLKQGAKHAGVPMTEVRDEIKNAKNVSLD